MRKEWRTYFKGDLVYIRGMDKTENPYAIIPAFLYESQGMKNIISIYCFGLYDEWGSSYLEDTQKATSVNQWLEDCEKQGYKKDYVFQKMKEFKISPPKMS